MFLIFIFDLEYLKQLQSSEPLHAKRPPILLLVRFTVCMSSSRDLFRQTVLHKCGRDINCSLDCGSQVKKFISRNPNQKRAALWRIFSVHQPIGKQGSMQTVKRTSRRLDSFLHEAAQNFELLSNIQDQKLKIKNI
jgi:hypothetical protein